MDVERTGDGPVKRLFGRLRATRPKGHTPRASASPESAPSSGGAPTAEAPRTPPGAERSEPPVGWSPGRIAVAERLFGSGFIAPSTPEYVRGLIAPLRLKPDMTVLEVGAGLGGNARIIAGDTGAKVVALEADPLLAEKGMERSAAEGVAERAPVRHFSPPDLRVAASSVDAVFARQAFFRSADKEALYAAIETALRAGGYLLFTDLMLTRQDSTAPRLVRWRETESAHPWTLRQTTKCLERLGLEIRVTAEVTNDLRALVLGAWGRFARELSGGLDRKTAAGVLAEGELWLQRLGLIDGGELIAYRVLAKKPGGEADASD